MASLDVQLTFSLMFYLVYFSVSSTSVGNICTTYFFLGGYSGLIFKGAFLKPNYFCGDSLCSVGLPSLLERQKQNVHQHNLVSTSRRTAGFSEEMQLSCISRTRWEAADVKQLWCTAVWIEGLFKYLKHFWKKSFEGQIHYFLFLLGNAFAFSDSVLGSPKTTPTSSLFCNLDRCPECFYSTGLFNDRRRFGVRRDIL